MWVRSASVLDAIRGKTMCLIEGVEDGAFFARIVKDTELPGFPFANMSSRIVGSEIVVPSTFKIKSPLLNSLDMEAGLPSSTHSITLPFKTRPI